MYSQVKVKYKWLAVVKEDCCLGSRGTVIGRSNDYGYLFRRYTNNKYPVYIMYTTNLNPEINEVLREVDLPPDIFK